MLIQFELIYAYTLPTAVDKLIIFKMYGSLYSTTNFDIDILNG